MVEIESVCTYIFKILLKVLFRTISRVLFNFSPLYLLNYMISELKVAFHITLTGLLNHLLDCSEILSMYR